MLLSESAWDFNRALSEAEMFGCAYGLAPVKGFPSPIPSMALIGKHSVHLETAFKYFADWGSQEDGEVVDITLVLRNDGSYLLGIQPNWERMFFRLNRETALVDPLMGGATWIKKIDTTNPMLRDWRDWLKTGMFPIEIGASTAKETNGIPDINTVVTVEGAPRFIKFEVVITTEQDEPDHWFFDIVDKSAGRRKRGKPPPKTPAIVAASRRRLIDTAFPVTRERVRRHDLLAACRAKFNDNSITRAQVEQATVNVLLSREWVGRDHYIGVDRLDDEWWHRVEKRMEVANANDVVAGIQLDTLAIQLQLDVEKTLQQHGSPLEPKFATNQKLFRRLGYGED